MVAGAGHGLGIRSQPVLNKKQGKETQYYDGKNLFGSGYRLRQCTNIRKNMKGLQTQEKINLLLVFESCDSLK